MSKSSTITEKGQWLHNPHAGEVLLEEFLKPFDLSQSAPARLDAMGGRTYTPYLAIRPG